MPAIQSQPLPCIQNRVIAEDQKRRLRADPSLDRFHDAAPVEEIRGGRRLAAQIEHVGANLPRFGFAAGIAVSADFIAAASTGRSPALISFAAG